MKNQPSSLSLDDYSKFQYMLAPPGVAKQIINQVTSFAFYEQPNDPNKSESQHRVMAKGPVIMFGYYFVCLLVFPSHILGMSEWISAEATKDKDDNKILRRFRYSYYYGLLKVDTRHMATEGGFRIVEYFDASFSVWIVMDVICALVITTFVAFLQACGYLDQNSLFTVATSIFIPLKIMNYLYRLQIR